MCSFELLLSLTLHTGFLSRSRGHLSPTSNLVNEDCWKLRGEGGDQFKWLSYNSVPSPPYRGVFPLLLAVAQLTCTHHRTSSPEASE